MGSPPGCFNPRPPRGGRHPGSHHTPHAHQEFQSTPPARGATRRPRASAIPAERFNPRPIHAITPKGIRFQSTPPARGATPARAVRQGAVPVSIHAPRAGGDAIEQAQLPLTLFQSTPPRAGGGLDVDPVLQVPGGFNPRPPARGATDVAGLDPGVEGFQSTPPARGATVRLVQRVGQVVFQSTPPARGATPSVLSHCYPTRYRSTYANLWPGEGLPPRLLGRWRPICSIISSLGHVRTPPVESGVLGVRATLA